MDQRHLHVVGSVHGWPLVLVVTTATHLPCCTPLQRSGAAGEASSYTTFGPFASALSFPVATVILDLVDRGVGPTVPH
jgi:hypothetical protein